MKKPTFTQLSVTINLLLIASVLFLVFNHNSLLKKFEILAYKNKELVSACVEIREDVDRIKQMPLAVQHVVPARSIMTSDEDDTFAFVPHRLDKDGIPFYPWSDASGVHQDIYVQIPPGGSVPQLISYPSRRVGGSEGPSDAGASK